MRIALVALLVLLVGCPEPFVTRVTDGDGRVWRIVKCARHTGCMQRASELCAGGYEERPNSKDPREMLIRCRGTANTTELADWQ